MKLSLKIILFSLVAVLVVLSGKDYFLKKYINHALKEEFSGLGSIQKAALRLNSLDLVGLSIVGEGFRLEADKVGLGWKFSGFNQPRISSLSVDNADLKITNLEGLENTIKEKLVFPGVPVFDEEQADKAKGININLDNIKVQIDKKGLVPLSILFSFKGSILGSRVERIDNLRIDKCVLESYHKKAVIQLHKLDTGEYLLNVPEVKYNDAKIEDIKLKLSLLPDKARFFDLDSDLLGDSALVDVSLDYKDYSKICLEADLKRLSFNRIKDVLVDKGDLSFEGRFDGKLDCCLKNFIIFDVGAKLYNNTGGRIDVKDRKAVSFLKERMTEDSYNTLMDSLHDYKYNEGKVEISRAGSDIVCGMVFSSPVAGERNITIKFHDFRGISR